MYTKKLIALGANLTLFVLGIIGCALEFGQHGFVSCIIFYTFNSNVLGTVAAGIMSWYLIVCIAKDTEKIPKWVIMFKYMATSVLTVTFLVVVFVLAPMYRQQFSSLGKSLSALLFKGNMLYQHFLCPVTAILSTLFVDYPLGEDEQLLGRRPGPFPAALIALIPTVIYAAVTILLNILGVLDGPYPFLRVRHQPVYASILWCVLILALAYAIAFVLARFGTMFKRPEPKKSSRHEPNIYL